MAMVYQIVTAAQEWLAARLAARAGPDPEAERRRAEAEEEARHQALRAHGTPVTPDSFAEWRRRFEAEAAAAKAAAAAGSGADKAGGGGGAAGAGEQRLTGKAWFLKQAAAGELVSGSEDEDAYEAVPAEEGLDAAPAADDDDEDEDEEEWEPSDDDEDDDDDDEMLESYLAGKK